METPLDLVLADQLAFVREGLGSARRVLEVGAGRGAHARRLKAEGLSLTAVDLTLPEKESVSGVRWVEEDFLSFEDEPFDALLFTSSLHHIYPLDAALDRARRLLVLGGALVVDEFALEAVDENTARWNYETQELLAAAGAYDTDHVRESPGGTFLDRWKADHEHHHGPPLHTGAAMLRGIEERFGSVKVARGAYLYRHIAARSSNVTAARHVKVVEERRISDGSLRAVGLRIVARRA